MPQSSVLETIHAQSDSADKNVKPQSRKHPNTNTIRWAAGLKSASKDEFIAEFKSLKPCVHGSDAHTITGIGKPAENKFCWIKSELTFEGLKQILYETEDRVYIGEKPAVLKNDYQVLESVIVGGAPDWFGNVTVPLNEDLVSIIGPRGSGKSALAEVIAFAGGASLFRATAGLEDTFLYKSARKSAANPNPVIGATVTLTWKNGEPDAVLLPTNLRSVTSRRNQITSAIAAIRGESGGQTERRTLAGVVQEINSIKERSKLTETKKKEYEKFQRDRQKLEELVSAIAREIKEIETVVAPKIKSDQEVRLERYLDSLELLKEEREILEKLYEPLKQALAKSNETARKLMFISRTAFDVIRHASRGIDLFDRRKSAFPDQESLEAALSKFFDSCQQSDFARETIKQAVTELLDSFRPSQMREQLRKEHTPKDFADWFFDVEAFSTTYAIKFDNKDLKFLSPGEKGIVLLLLYLEAEEGDNRPLIIDQPDDNLDNLSVYPNLIEYFRARKKTRQIIIITHNPNLVVNTDSEQVIVASFDGTRSPKLEYRSGALEDTNQAGPVHGIREDVCRILEGGTKAFQLREARYALPRNSLQ